MARITVANQLAAIRKQRELLDKKEQALKSKSHDKVLAKIIMLAKEAGLTASDLTKALGSTKSSKASKTPKTIRKGALAGKKVALKYRNPSNPEQTWTGRGVSPAWVQALKAAGTLDSALITPSAA
ncbi:H-NS histone family protein [Limnohabitans sp.]|uniref:H-NS histone family protein n=1 Tax=Limnohabitans sp. TaxID=1907725 RepID=UPI00286F17AF|nr:H-NS histone family protein [Limnohabitans sp.]